MNHHSKLFSIILIVISVIIFAITIGIESSETPIATLALCFIPIALITVSFIKEKIWYTWFLLPPVFLPLDTFSNYNYLIILIGTLPFYCWYILKKQSTLTWHKSSLLDFPVFIFILYVIFVFLNNPFGIQANLFEDYYGGRGYITIAQGAIAFFLLSSLKTNTTQIGKLLNWNLLILIFFTLITTVKEFLLQSEQSFIGTNATLNIGEARESGVVIISVLILKLLIIKFTISDFIKKVWPFVLALSCCYGILISGFRSYVAVTVFFFFCICVLYRRWSPIIIIPLLGISSLILLSTTGGLRELPIGVQRCFAPLEFLDIDPEIRIDATHSTDWRTQMWEWALDDREHFIKDKIWGDGFSRNIYTLKAINYMHAHKIREYGDYMGNSDYAYNGVWHSGPITTLNALGYVGLSLLTIVFIISFYYSWSVCNIFKHSPYRLGILYVALSTFILPLYFFFIFGDAQRDISTLLVNLATIKLLYCLARKEKLYIPISTRKEYIPMMCRQANSEPA